MVWPSHGNVLSSPLGFTNIKMRMNHRVYLETLRRMIPRERLDKAFEITEFSRQLFIHGLRRRFPDISEDALMEIYLERLDKCHNRNY
jgi:hypothetical protein